MLLTLTVTANAWGATYNFSNIPTTGWTKNGGSQTINEKKWTYSSSTYIGITSSKIQVGSSNNPQTSNWTIQIPISSFGTNIKITKVSITAYTTATTATYDITVGGSSVKSGSLTTSSATYSSSTLNATTGNIVVTLKGSNKSKAMYLSNIAVTYETAAATTYTVTLKDDNSTLTQSTAGGSVTLPSREGCDGYKFVGWTKSWSVAQTSWTTTAPTIIPAGSYTPTANESLYPVYTKTEGGTPVPATLTASYTSYSGWTATNCGGSSYWVLKDGASITSPVISDLSTVTSITFKVRTYGGDTYKTVNVSTSGGISIGSASASNTTLTSKTINVSPKLSGNGSIVFSSTTTSTSYGPGINEITINYSTGGSTTYYISVPDCTTETAVTLNPNGGTGTAQVLETTDGSLTLPECDFIYEGYRFVGWNTKANGTGTTYQPSAKYTPTENPATLYAKWAKEYTVTYNANGGTTTCEDNKKYIAGEQVTVCTSAPTRDSYTFNGWSYSPNVAITDGQFTMPENDVTITAQWTSNKTATSLSWSAATYSATIDADNTFPTLTVNPEAIKESVQYTSFDETIATIDANGIITLLKAGTTTITASYDEDDDYLSATASYTLTVHPSNCRWVEVTDNTTLEDGDEVVITMSPDGNTYYALPNDQGTSIPNGTLIDNLDGNKINTVVDKLKWTVEKTEGNYIFHPNGNNAQWLYCINSDDGVRVGNGAAKTFILDPTNGYLVNTQTTSLRYLRLGLSGINYVWRCYTTNTAGQTLKFYKKECIASDEYWIIYNLENVTCNSEMPNYIGTDGEIELYFCANSGYKLPEQVSITMGGLPLSEDAFAWEAEEGLLYIRPDGGITGNLVITIEGCELLALPTNLKATNITSSSARLTWDEIDHATEYQVHITDDDDSTEDIITTTSSTYFEITGLKSASPYLWGVTPIASGYCGITQEAEYFETLDVYTVTFNSNGGTAVEPQTVDVDAGSKITAPANPSAAGYTFNYWYTTDANVPFDFNTPITGNTTLNAKWTPNVYTITFYKQSGTGGTDNATVTFNSNNYSVSTIEAPTRDKYAFGGYYTEQHGAGIQVVDADGNWLKNVAGYTDANGNWIKAENTHLYAKWTAIYTITWVVNNNTETPYHTSTVLSGSTIDQLPTPPADDLFADCDVNAFVGWSTDNIGFDPDPTAPTDLFKTVAEAQNKIGAISADKKFYAVYASASNGADSYKPATTVEDLFDGQTVIIAKDNGALERDNNTIDKVNISPDGNGNLSNVTDNIKWTLEASDTHWKLKNNGGYLGVTSTASQTAVSVTEINNVWQIAKSSATGNYFYICQPNTTTGLQYYNSRWQIFSNNGIASSTNFTLKIYVPNVSNYITRCTALPDPVWGEATIDKTEIAVNCGETSSTNGAARISFPKETNYNLYKDITVEVTSGNFIIASSRDGEYSTSVTLTPTQSGTNVGTLDGKYVYVRAVAPPMSSDQLTGTITISGKQIATQVINVTATVTCNEYTLTFNDCGDKKKITDFAGTSVEEMEPWAETCSEPFQYVFDGWATAPVTNGTEEYDKVNFSTFTMPNNNTTILYAVYRYAEEGGEPVNGYVKVTEALSDWSGDYVIVDDEFNVAIQNTYEEDTKDNKTLKDVSVTIKNDKIVSPTNDIIWTISKYGEYYTVYNAEAIKYAGITKNETRAAGLSETIATGYSMNIIFDSNTKIAKVSSTNYNRCFSYSESYPEWRTYSNNDAKGKTGYLYRFSNKTIRYTSSLVCGTIEAEDALVTSTKDQKVKVKVPITLESSTGVTTINATSDNAAFDVTGLMDVEEGDHTIVVEYTPAEYNITETANITLSATNGATATFTVSGRSLPENFVIATKVGATWYALPANMNGATNPEGVVIDVDETTMTATAPNTTVYTLFPVKTTTGSEDRYAQYGDRVRFSAVNNDYKGLWTSSSESTIRNYAVIDDVKDGSSDASYEWKITTTIVDGNWQYTLQTDQSNNKKYLRYWTAASGGAKWGTYASGNDKLYFLPVTETKPFDYKVVEWYPTKMLIQTEAAITNPIVKIGGILVDHVTCTNKGGKLYEISGLSLAENPTKVLTLSYTADEVTYTNSKVVPIILSRETKSISGEPFVALTKEVYNYADLVVRDGAILTMDGTQEANTLWDVTIYPTSKIYVPETKKLTVHSLTFFGGIDEIYNGSTSYTLNKYGVPELSLKGSLKKSISTIDYLMRVNLDQMYSLTVPYDVQLADIKYWDGSDIALGSALYVSAYDGQARANRESKTWVYETDFATKFGSATLKAGVGYTISAELQAGVGNEYSILRMPMNSNIANDATEGEKKVSVTAHGIDANITDNHKGWNLVGNPYMTTIQGADDADLVLGRLQETGTGPWEWVEKTYRYVTIPADNGKDYSQQKFIDAVLPPFKNFFVQVGTTGELVFDLGTRQSMPARSAQAAIEKEVEFEILMSNDARQDNTGLFISEEYSPAYEINADLEKMIGSMSVYTIYGGYKLAYNALSPINASEWIPMGYIAPTAGEYTFRLDDAENIAEQVEHVYVIDYDANNIVDLMTDEYKFTTNKEQNDNRFAINVVLSQDKDNTTTGLDIIQGNNTAPIKFIYHDKMYIQSGGVIYDATGKQVTNINK